MGSTRDEPPSLQTSNIKANSAKEAADAEEQKVIDLAREIAGGYVSDDVDTSSSSDSSKTKAAIRDFKRTLKHRSQSQLNMRRLMGN